VLARHVVDLFINPAVGLRHEAQNQAWVHPIKF
jgi:hypothetical protein